MLMIYVFLLVVSGVLAGVGGLGLVTSTSLNLLDRRREIGVLRAIGASPRMVAAIIVVEAAVIAVMAWVLAVAASWPITVGAGRLITAALFRQGLEVVLALDAVLVWLGVSTALAVAASLAPAVIASRRPIREAISHE